MFKEYNQEQNFLIPPSYEEFLWKKHESKLLNNIINWLDLKYLYESYNNQKTWTTAYNPVMLLKILFYWYMNSVFSSRKIANKLKSDLWFMYLAWNNQPDFRTINNFRKNKWELLEKVFVEIVYLASELWLVKFGTFSIDWTQIYANASKHKNIDLDRLKEKIWWLFKEADNIDDLENEIYWDKEDNLPEELSNSEKQKEAIEKARKKYKELQEKLNNENDKIQKQRESWKKDKKLLNKINPTDSDSRFQKMKKWDTSQWYNCQIVTENQIIIWNYVIWKPWDKDTLVPTLNKIKEKFKKLPKQILADKWYWTEENYKFLENEKVESYIPHQEYSKVDLSNFIYNKNIDIYEDIDWNIYKFKQFVWNLKWNKKWRPRKEEKMLLKEKDYQAKLYMTKLENWENKFLQISKNQKEVYQRNDERLYSEKWKRIYSKRANEVEAVFWNTKHNLWFNRFLLRWLKWVQIEWNLINLAHNLKKIIKFQIS